MGLRLLSRERHAWASLDDAVEYASSGADSLSLERTDSITDRGRWRLERLSFPLPGLPAAREPSTLGATVWLAALGHLLPEVCSVGLALAVVCLLDDELCFALLGEPDCPFLLAWTGEPPFPAPVSLRSFFPPVFWPMAGKKVERPSMPLEASVFFLEAPEVLRPCLDGFFVFLVFLPL